MENIAAFSGLDRMSSTVGMMCCYLMTVVLAPRIPRQRQIFPGLGLGTTTTEFSQVVGPSTCSMVSRASRHCNSSVTSCRVGYGMQRIGCCIGVTFLSMCSFSLKSFSLPRPSKTVAFFLKNVLYTYVVNLVYMQR